MKALDSLHRISRKPSFVSAVRAAIRPCEPSDDLLPSERRRRAGAAASLYAHLDEVIVPVRREGGAFHPKSISPILSPITNSIRRAPAAGDEPLK
jgi:hypothetical protein